MWPRRGGRALHWPRRRRSAAGRAAGSLPDQRVCIPNERFQPIIAGLARAPLPIVPSPLLRTEKGRLPCRNKGADGHGDGAEDGDGKPDVHVAGHPGDCVLHGQPDFCLHQQCREELGKRINIEARFRIRKPRRGGSRSQGAQLEAGAELQAENRDEVQHRQQASDHQPGSEYPDDSCL